MLRKICALTLCVWSVFRESLSLPDETHTMIWGYTCLTSQGYRLRFQNFHLGREMLAFCREGPRSHDQMVLWSSYVSGHRHLGIRKVDRRIYRIILHHRWRNQGRKRTLQFFHAGCTHHGLNSSRCHRPLCNGFLLCRCHLLDGCIPRCINCSHCRSIYHGIYIPEFFNRTYMCRSGCKSRHLCTVQSHAFGCLQLFCQSQLCNTFLSLKRLG